MSARTAATRSATSRGTATPMVSAIATSATPVAASCSATLRSRSTGTSPANGQPKATDSVTVGVIPAARARGTTSVTTPIACSVLIAWFARENSSVTPTTQLTSSTPAAAARSNPRVLSTSPIHDAGPGTSRRTPDTTASPSAICGTSLGLTNEAISARRRPAAAQRETSSTFCSVLRRAGSFWSPSRALTSTTWMALTGGGALLGGPPLTPRS